MTVLRELSKYRIVGVQEVGWESSGTVSAGQCKYFYGKVNENLEFGAVLF
jgi:hypothetical protein